MKSKNVDTKEICTGSHYYFVAHVSEAYRDDVKPTGLFKKPMLVRNAVFCCSKCGELKTIKVRA